MKKLHAFEGSTARFMTVASPSTLTDDEWVKKGHRREDLHGPVHRDYALLKVLYMLRFWDKTRKVQTFKYEEPLVPLDFSGLEDSDWIYVVGHGDDEGIYAMGPNSEENVKRLVKILTGDGNLAKKRKGKPITILLLSCRAGLGLYRVVARKLFEKLGRDVKVGGAIGFTFGTISTGYHGYNDVLIKGLPWYMEYETSITLEDAEEETKNREGGKEIKYKDKEKEILRFKLRKKELEDKMKTLIGKVGSTEVNNALDEIENKFRPDWESLIKSQITHYSAARKVSDLEFDMWYPDLNKAYAWTNGSGVTNAEVDAFFSSSEKVDVPGGSLTSVK